MSVSEKLNKYYNSLESRFGNRTINSFNRGTMIIVGGKSVAELMQEQYIKQLGMTYSVHRHAMRYSSSYVTWFKHEFNQWYNKNLDQLCLQFVEEALQAGKPVEVFSLNDINIEHHSFNSMSNQSNKSSSFNNPSGEKEDVVPLLSGQRAIEAAQQELKKQEEARKKVQETWNKPEYQALQKAARKRVSANLMRARCIMYTPKNMWSQFTTEEPPKGDPFASVCIGLLAAQEKAPIWNTLALQAKKQDVATTYTRNKNNPKWLGEQIFKGQQALLNQLDAEIAIKNSNNQNGLKQTRFRIHLVGYALLEMNNYLEKNKEARKAYTALAKNEKATFQTQSTVQRSQRVSNLAQIMYWADHFRENMIRPLLTLNQEEVSTGLTCTLLERYFLDTYNKKIPFSSHGPNNETYSRLCDYIKEHHAHQQNVQRLSEGWENWEEGTQYVLSNRFTDGVTSTSEEELEMLDNLNEPATHSETLHLGKAKIFQYPSRLTTVLAGSPEKREMHPTVKSDGGNAKDVSVPTKRGAGMHRPK